MTTTYVSAQAAIPSRAHPDHRATAHDYARSCTPQIRAQCSFWISVPARLLDTERVTAVCGHLVETACGETPVCPDTSVR
jgi:hypothetical protein